MKFSRLAIFTTVFGLAFASVRAQVAGPVTPAYLPIPLAGSGPVSPAALRGDNPWNLPMTGEWRFKLTHGRIVGQEFEPAVPAEALGVSASSSESGHEPLNAFDGKTDTRWCAAGGDFPQWLGVDFRSPRTVTAAEIEWERPGRYQFRLEGSLDGKAWLTLADRSAAPGAANRELSLGDRSVRYVRLNVLSAEPGSWASVREFAIHVRDGGTDKIWRPDLTPPSKAGIDAFIQPGYSDRAWDKIRVPSNWEMLGYSIPTYNSVDNSVGLYRRWVQIPSKWNGRRTFWRFDGALDGAEVFVNGKKAGYHESGYTAFDIDVTGLIKPGSANLFALRVSKEVPSYECETGDFQCMGGVYRDTSLISVPQTHVRDLTIDTTLKNGSKDAKLTADFKISGLAGSPVEVDAQVIGIHGDTVGHPFGVKTNLNGEGEATVKLVTLVSSPKLWSAEKPNLYYLLVKLKAGSKVTERVEQRFGFRQIEFKGDVLLWNGKAIKCTGICRHDFWADKGFALTDKEWNTDLTLMKAANINAIRTSHYNHAARFLELCEERGMYILDEVPFCWIGDKNDDPAFAPALLQRAADTLGRDKNRPCVLAWSLGNENGVARNSQTVIDYVKSHDPTRPAFVGQGGDYGPKGQSFQDMHYPSPEDVDRYQAIKGPRLTGLFTEQPHTFYEKEQQDYDPGVSDLWTEAIQETWDRVWPNANVLGSFIWEWQSQGIADKFPDKSREFYYGKDHLRQENNKGVVSAYRVPKPEYWIVKTIYTPVLVDSTPLDPQADQWKVRIANRFSFTNLNELTCKVQVLRGQTVIGMVNEWISCKPGESVTRAVLPSQPATAIRIAFVKPDGTLVTAVRIPVGKAAVSASAAEVVHPDFVKEGEGLLKKGDQTDSVTVLDGDLEFKLRSTTGSVLLTERGKVLTDGVPWMNLGEGLQTDDREFLRFDGHAVIRRIFLNHTTDAGGLHSIELMGQLTDPSGKELGDVSWVYRFLNHGVKVDWKLFWKGPSCRLSEIGIGFKVPSNLSHLEWTKRAYFTEYPEGHIGEPEGTATPGSDLFRSSKRGLVSLRLTDAAGDGLELRACNIGRVVPTTGGFDLFASKELAGPKGLSWSWIKSHDILAAPGKEFTGSLELAGVSGSKPAPLH